MSDYPQKSKIFEDPFYEWILMPQAHYCPVVFKIMKATDYVICDVIASE
jgi:hypothetical protein